MSTGYIGGGAATKLGWQGQGLLTVPKTGLAIAPGAGLTGRTDAVNNVLYLDTQSAAVSEFFSAFAPGAVTTRTFTKWRNRRPLQNGTLTVVDVYAATAPTPDAAPLTNYWRLVITDSLANTIVVPLSQDASNLHSLDRAAGVALIAPWGTYTTGGLAAGTPNGMAFAYSFSPTQGMVIGGFTMHGYLWNNDGSATKRSGMRVRVVLCDNTSSANVLATGYAWATGTYDAAGFEEWDFTFDNQVQLVAGTKYWIGIDCSLDIAVSNQVDMRLPFRNGGTMAQAAPGRLYSVGDNVGVAIAAAAVDPVSWDMRAPGIGFGNGGVTGQALVAKAVAQDSSGAFGLIVQNGDMGGGFWQLNGTVSGVAPVSGDLTFAFGAVGAPAAGSGGSDVNVRAVITP